MNLAQILAENPNVILPEEKHTHSKTLWVKMGDVASPSFVGKDVIGVGQGCHIVFYDTVSHTDHIYRANNQKHGDGIACFAGHRYIPIFGFAEKSINPRIMVFTFPEFQPITTIHNSTNSEYTALRFTETDYIIALTGFPDYSLNVFSWRSGHLLGTTKTFMFSDNQHFIVSPTQPTSIAQASANYDKMLLWEANASGGKVMLSKKKIDLIPPAPPHLKAPPAPNLCFSFDGCLYVIDYFGNVGQVMTESGTVERLFNWPDDMGQHKVNSAWYKQGLVIAGPNAVIKYFLKTPTAFVQIWSQTPPIPLIKMGWGFGRDVMNGWNIHGECIEFKIQENEETEFKAFKKFDRSFLYIGFLMPLAEHVVTLNTMDILAIWKKRTGDLVGQIELRMGSTYMLANPNFPYVAIARMDGILHLINCYYPETPTSMCKFRLSSHPIQRINYTKSGEIMVVCNMDLGEIFVIKGLPGALMEVIYYIEAHHQLARFAIMQFKDQLYLPFLMVTSSNSVCGSRLLCYTLPLDFENAVFSEKYFLDMMGMYKSIQQNYFDGELMIFAVPYMSRTIHVLKFNYNPKKCVRLIRTICSGHMLRNINMSMDKYHTTTSGMDGLVIVHKGGIKNTEGSFIVMTHHRNDGGVHVATMDPFMDSVMSLGRDGSIICIKLKYVRDTSLYMEVKAKYEDPLYKTMFDDVTEGFWEYEGFGKTWAEFVKDTREEEEYAMCIIDRDKILEELEELRVKVVKLLEVNFDLPPEETLPIQAFNLDTENTEYKIKKAKEDRDIMKTNIINVIHAHDTVKNWIIENSWTKMAIKGQCIQAIRSNFEVENYALLPPDGELMKLIGEIEMQRDLENMLSVDDLFNPWLPKTAAVLSQMLKHVPEIQDIERTRLTRVLLMDEEDQDQAEGPAPLPTGSTAHLFIAPNISRCNQFEITTILQMKWDEVLLQQDILKLREYFNTQFQEMMQQKEREMYVIAERNERLRHILREKNTLAQLRNQPEDEVSIQIDDPTWGAFERPDSIIRVEDWEVPVPRYISPSEQELLDQRAAEEERIRLLLLADDFRERALIVMMNGVLEVLWEDEIKKTPPPPKCMKDKKPEDFNEEDLRLVKEYEDKLEFLKSEREKYRKMLDVEFEKIIVMIKKNQLKFNKRLADLLVLKLKVDSAINQECLKVARNRAICFNRTQRKLQDKKIEGLIKDCEDNIEKRQSQVAAVVDRLRDCKRVYENMCTKDRAMDRNFKSNFEDKSSVIQDNAYKAFKKRPKLHPKLLTSSAVLLQLAKACTSDEKPSYMPPESWEYVKNFAALESYSNAPRTLDEVIWKQMCKLRANKIDLELKIKAQAIELSENEQTYNAYNKKLQTAKERLVTLTERLRLMREERITLLKNMDVQVVMPSGLVEVKLTGNISDFQDSILICKTDIEKINDIIKKAGEKKLRTMVTAMNFRRKILCKEWEHKYMRMKIEDMQDQFRTIDRVKVSKEIQGYLRRQKLGVPESVGPLALEKELTAIKNKMLKILNDIKKECLDMDARVEAVRRENKILDKRIADTNVNKNEQNQMRDMEFEKLQDEAHRRRMQTIVLRTRLIRKVQEQHGYIVELQTELELVRLKTFPSLHYKTIKGAN